MSIIEIFLIGISLSMDAFAVSICKGLSMKKLDMKKALIIGLYFGLFQAIMPLTGFFLGKSFEAIVNKWDHWIGFILLVLIGANMIKESLSDEDENQNDKVDFKTMIVLAIATSIDALAVGITFAFEEVNIWISILIIGITTFILSVAGVKIGNRFGSKYEKWAGIVGGIVLIIIGMKILVEGLGLI